MIRKILLQCDLEPGKVADFNQVLGSSSIKSKDGCCQNFPATLTMVKRLQTDPRIVPFPGMHKTFAYNHHSNTGKGEKENKNPN